MVEIRNESRRAPLEGFDERAALRSILEGTATHTGAEFFTALVDNLARALGTYAAWVTEFVVEEAHLRTVAFRMGEEWIPPYIQQLDGTPCELVVQQKKMVHYPDGLRDLFPGDPDLSQHNIVSYMGSPLLDLEGNILGHLAVMDQRPMPEEPRAQALFRIFADRAAAELMRLRAEEATRLREMKLSRLINGAMDAIVEVDAEHYVTLMNPAAEKMFGCKAEDELGEAFCRFFVEEDRRKLGLIVDDLGARPDSGTCVWIPDQLAAVRSDGEEFAVEVTVSKYESHGQPYFTLILRNIDDRVRAEKRIRDLMDQTDYLREELKEYHNFGEIIGRSEAMMRVLHDIGQVADTDATVLLLGETGTGKELIARAIHNGSRRKEKPLIKVNCAAIPANLIESEFFGHERGAFTGATARREGRFALADGGTIFLDEVGELPLDLQGKLLRVLQEGEFEAVGSSRTRKVNVRVIAATNRSLYTMVREGEFRDDLYYRLNVFPIKIPPLRERGDDVVLLANAFARQYCRRMGREYQPLKPEAQRRLKRYDWPGNVRELQNVIERAAITARDGCLDLERALPDVASLAVADVPPAPDAGESRVRTVQEMQQLEKENILLALEQTRWQVSGENGAAALLGMKPSTLSSRIKALGLRKPAG